MYRIVKLSGKFFAIEIDSLGADSENINSFVASGDPVILCDDLEDFADMVDIDIEDIEEVDAE